MVYVPTLQLTEGQPPPIAANGGLAYMSFDRDGDAGTAAAIEAALDQIAEGHAQAIEFTENTAPAFAVSKNTMSARMRGCSCPPFPAEPSSISSGTSCSTSEWFSGLCQSKWT